MDDWNKTFLANGIACLSAGLYGLAIADARMARIPQEQRSAAFAADPQISALGRQQLEATLERLVARPYRPATGVLGDRPALSSYRGLASFVEA